MARFAFAAHPDALEDLRHAPDEIRDLALLALQELVHAEQRGQRLEDRPGAHLRGCRKLYVDAHVGWRIVYQERPAPPDSAHSREIYLVAMRPRNAHDVYNTAAARLGRTRAPVSSLADAARTRSPQLTTATPGPAAATVSSHRPAIPLTPVVKGPAR